MSEQRARRTGSQFGEAVRDALERQSLDDMLAADHVGGGQPAAAASEEAPQVAPPRTPRRASKRANQAAARGATLVDAAAEVESRAAVAAGAVELVEVEAAPDVQEPAPAEIEPVPVAPEATAAVSPDVDPLSGEVQRLQGEIAVLHSRVRRPLFERDEAPFLIMLAAALVAIIVYQLSRGYRHPSPSAENQSGGTPELSARGDSFDASRMSAARVR